MQDINITEAPIAPAELIKSFTQAMAGQGAIVSFTGLVRDDGGTESLTLSHYPGFTEKQITKIGSEAMARWPLAGFLIHHRVGKMTPGEPIVCVATASAHRRAAFDACDFLMDYLKSNAPFWKQETRGGEAKWIEPRAEDYTDKARWAS